MSNLYSIPWQSHHFLKPSQMGSFVHAKSVQAEKEKIRAVYVLDMIGYYDKNLVAKLPNGFKVDLPKSWQFYCGIE